MNCGKASWAGKLCQWACKKKKFKKAKGTRSQPPQSSLLLLQPGKKKWYSFMSRDSISYERLWKKRFPLKKLNPEEWRSRKNRLRRESFVSWSCIVCVPKATYNNQPGQLLPPGGECFFFQNRRYFSIVYGVYGQSFQTARESAISKFVIRCFIFYSPTGGRIEVWNRVHDKCILMRSTC